MEVAVRVRASELRCAVCHDRLAGETVPCSGCGAVAHTECRTPGCSTLGCRERRKVQVRPRRAGGRWLTALLAITTLALVTARGLDGRAHHRLSAGVGRRLA